MLTGAKVLLYPTLPTYVHTAGINQQNSSHVLLCMCEETALVYYSAGQQSCVFVSVHTEYYYYGNYWCCVVQGKHNLNPLELDEQNSRYNYYSNWGQDKQLGHPSVTTRWWCGVNTMWLFSCLFRSIWHQAANLRTIYLRAAAHVHLQGLTGRLSSSPLHQCFLVFYVSFISLSFSHPWWEHTQIGRKKCWLWAG